MIDNFDDPVPIRSSDWQCYWLSAGMAIGSLKTTTRERKVVSRVLDSLRESLVLYSRAVCSGLECHGLKIIRVINHSAMNNIKIIDAHN